MFIGLTFVVFFFVELLTGRRIHPVQYLLVGAALILFYSLLLSLSEHIGFGWAYLVAAVATVALITAYASSIFRRRTQHGHPLRPAVRVVRLPLHGAATGGRGVAHRQRGAVRLPRHRDVRVAQGGMVQGVMLEAADEINGIDGQSRETSRINLLPATARLFR